MLVYALAHLRKRRSRTAGAGELSRVPTSSGSIADAGPLAKVVLLILLLFSAVSWGIILYKFWQFRRAAAPDGDLPAMSSARAASFPKCRPSAAASPDSPLVGLFQAGYAELNAQLRASPAGRCRQSRRPAAGRPTLKSLDAVDRALLRATTRRDDASSRSRVPFLATTASITPFIGLFGTVWGIMTRSRASARRARRASASSRPGIAEALIATAAGLFAAIPAVYFYNHFTNRVKEFATRWTTSRWSS